MARTKIKSPQLDPSKTTDANGWTVYDYGAWKEYRKRVTYSQALTAGGAAYITVSSSTLPSGMSTLGTNFFNYSVVSAGASGNLNFFAEMLTSATSAVFVAKADASLTYSGFIDMVITTP